MTQPLAPAQALPTLRLRLPGDWWTTSLRDREAALDAAKRLIRHRLGTSDEKAGLRARLHRDFVAAIDAAISGNGQSMFIAIQLVAGVPLPVTITIYLPEVAMTPSIGTSGERVIDILQQGLEGLDAREVVDLGDLSRLEVANTAAVRSSRIRGVEVGDGTDSGILDVFVVDYWLAVPGTKRVLLVNFSTSFAELHEYLLAFFDAIMRVAYWDAPESADPVG